MRYTYQDLKIGQSARYSVKVTEKMLDAFCRITDDINPLHNDANYARKHGFKDRVGYGLLTASFLSTLVGVYLPGEKCLIQGLDIKFSRSVKMR